MPIPMHRPTSSRTELTRSTNVEIRMTIPRLNPQRRIAGIFGTWQARLQRRPLKPFHAGDFASHLADARNCLPRRLDGNRHVEGVGVNDRVRAARDGNMALPENQ